MVPPSSTCSQPFGPYAARVVTDAENTLRYPTLAARHDPVLPSFALRGHGNEDVKSISRVPGPENFLNGVSQALRLGVRNP
jgi:hypothetical protein